MERTVDPCTESQILEYVIKKKKSHNNNSVYCIASFSSNGQSPVNLSFLNSEMARGLNINSTEFQYKQKKKISFYLYIYKFTRTEKKISSGGKRQR